jgi:mannose-6-phosphate isomerase
MQNVTNAASVAPMAYALARSERPWGWFETLAEVSGYKIKRIQVMPGHQLSLQKHRQRKEHWLVVQGVALVTVGEAVMRLAVGEHVDIACGQVHRLSNQTQDPVEIIELQLGDYLGEDDIERLGDDYGRD